MIQKLNYRHLYYFWVVAKQGGLSRAATRLGIAVQTVSAQVRELERSLGFALLRPAGRGVMLTEADRRPCARPKRSSSWANSWVVWCAKPLPRRCCG